MRAVDVIGAALLVALAIGLAWDVYRLGRRHGHGRGYHEGQLDAALDFKRGYQHACGDVIREAETATREAAAE